MKRGGGSGYIFDLLHIIEFLMNIWWQIILIRSQIIICSYLCDQNWWNFIKKKLIRVFISVHWSAFSKYGSTFICWRHTWRDLAYEYSWAKVPMISGYVNPFSGSWEEVSWKSTNQNFQSHMVAMFFDESAQK